MIKKHTISFKNAINGLLWVLKTQPNYRIHLFFSFAALGAGYFLKISYEEFLTILVLIAAGLAIETVNTAIEATNDAIDTKWREEIKIAKDISSAAVLIFSFFAFVTACIIFIPKIYSVFGIILPFAF